MSFVPQCHMCGKATRRLFPAPEYGASFLLCNPCRHREYAVSAALQDLEVSMRAALVAWCRRWRPSLSASTLADVMATALQSPDHRNDHLLPRVQDFANIAGTEAVH